MIKPLIFLFTTITILSAQIIVPGQINLVDEWNNTDSSYIITGDLRILNLTIGPGVVVEFRSDYDFRIDGSLMAHGTFSDSIKFMAEDINSDGWNGIHVNTSATDVLLNFCKIDGGRNQGIFIEADNVEIANCDILNSAGNGIFIDHANLVIRNSKIMQNNFHGFLFNQARVDFSNVAITNNGINGIQSISDRDTISLINSIVVDNDGIGIFFDRGEVNILNSIIFNNQISIDSRENNTNITFSNIEYEGLYPGEGNIQYDPLFISNYALNVMSPCIDSGSTFFEYSDIYFPPSHGDVRNDMGIYGGPLAANWLEPSLQVSQTVFDFGSAGISFMKIDTLIIRNTSDTEITISDIEFSGFDSSVFSTETTIFNVAAYDSVLIELGFSPTQVRSYNAEITIIHSSGRIKNLLSGEGLAPSVSVSRNILNFGAIFTGMDSIQQLTFYNNGNSDLIIYSDSLWLFANPNFSFEDIAEDIIIPVLDSAVINIIFRPVNTGYTETTLHVISNDPDNKEILVNLSGTGRFNVNFFPIITTSQSSIDFGEVHLNEDSTQSLMIYNNGLADLIIYSDGLNFSGVGRTFFTIDTLQNDVVITSGDSIVLVIRFTPAITGYTETILHIISNDPDRNEVQISISGSGSFSDTYFPRISVSHAAIDFGEVYVNEDSILSLTIYNSGLANLVLYSDSLNISGPGKTFFSIDTLQNDVVITSGDSSKLEIRFAPANLGETETMLHIKSNDPDNPEIQINLSGSGSFSDNYFPLINVSKSEMYFGEVYIDEDSTQKLSIYNNGLANLILYSDSIAFSGSGQGFFTIDSLQNDAVIASGDSSIFNVTFNPTMNGFQLTVLNIYHNDKQNNPKQISISGIGITKVSTTIDLNDIISTEKLTMGESGLIAFDIQSNVPVDSGFIYLRKGGSSNYIKNPLINQNGDTWQHEIDKNIISERGLEYYLKSYHSGRGIIFPDNGDEYPLVLEVTIPFLNFPVQTKENIYQLISLPVNTDQQSLLNIIGDDLGNYDNTKYRVFDYSKESGYEELIHLEEPLPPGKSLWLITKTPKLIDIENSTSVPTSERFLINLNSGWNLISNPFSFPVLWNDIDANNVLRFYDGSDWLFSSVMQPFKGYLVRVENDTIISVPPVEYQGLQKESVYFPSNEWYFQIIGKDEKFPDHYNFAGVNSKASNLIDKYDYYEPPPIGHYFSVYFEIDESKDRFSTDVREPGQDGYSFSLNVDRDIDNKSAIEIIPFNIPDNFDWTLVSKKEMLNYGKNEIFIYENTRHYDLLVGTKEFINQNLEGFYYVPTRIFLSQNYPNPFNPVTSLNFQLDKPEKVQMDVYNILGQKVKSLINSKIFNEGFHTVIWNGTNSKNEKVASGIYFLSFNAGKFSKSYKMIFKK